MKSRLQHLMERGSYPKPDAPKLPWANAAQAPVSQRMFEEAHPFLILEKYYDDFGNTGATPTGVGNATNRKNYAVGDDPYANGEYIWDPKKNVPSVDVADTEQRINITLRPGGHFRKMGEVVLEFRGFTLTVSGAFMDKIMGDSQLIKDIPGV